MGYGQQEANIFWQDVSTKQWNVGMQDQKIVFVGVSSEKQ
jgi:hypothetical protein